MGSSHTCARMDSAPEVLCWGSNHSGQLSLKPDDQIHLKPTPIAGLKSSVLSIGAGVQHTCALFDHAISCWGDNALGQLGSRDLKGSYKPTDLVPLN